MFAASSTDEVPGAVSGFIIFISYRSYHLICISFFWFSVVFYNRPEGETKRDHQTTERRRWSCWKSFMKASLIVKENDNPADSGHYNNLTERRRWICWRSSMKASLTARAN